MDPYDENYTIDTEPAPETDILKLDDDVTEAQNEMPLETGKTDLAKNEDVEAEDEEVEV